MTHVAPPSRSLPLLSSTSPITKALTYLSNRLWVVGNTPSTPTLNLYKVVELALPSHDSLCKFQCYTLETSPKNRPTWLMDANPPPTYPLAIRGLTCNVAHQEYSLITYFEAHRLSHGPPHCITILAPKCLPTFISHAFSCTKQSLDILNLGDFHCNAHDGVGRNRNREKQSEREREDRTNVAMAIGLCSHIPPPLKSSLKPRMTEKWQRERESAKETGRG